MTFITDDGCWWRAFTTAQSRKRCSHEESNWVQSGMQQLQSHFNLQSGIIAVYIISHSHSDAYWRSLLKRKRLNFSRSILQKDHHVSVGRDVFMCVSRSWSILMTQWLLHQVALKISDFPASALCLPTLLHDAWNTFMLGEKSCQTCLLF